MVPKGPSLIPIWVCLKLDGPSLRPWVHQCSPMFTMIFPTKKQPFGGIPYFQPKGHIHKYVCFGTGVPHGTPAFRPVRLGWGDASLMLVFFHFPYWNCYLEISTIFSPIYIYIFVQNIWGSWYCSPCASATMYSIVWLLGLVMMRRMIHAFWGCEEEWCSVCFRAIHKWVCLIPSHT
jgi:hypothetical protein